MNLFGRIIRGKNENDFVTMSDDPQRKIVMLVNPDGLTELISKNGYEMLLFLGYKPKYLKHKIQEGNQFKLVVFPEGERAKLGTWENVFNMVEKMYPVIIFPEDIRQSLNYTPFSEIKDQCDYRFLEIEEAEDKVSDPRFMTYEKFLQSEKTLLDYRAFLYFTIHLRELYSGDSWTRDSNGKKGVREYIIPNLPIAELKKSKIIDIEVNLPKKS